MGFNLIPLKLVGLINSGDAGEDPLAEPGGLPLLATE